MDKKTKNKDRYFEAVGRRKTAVARVRITEATKADFKVNEKDMDTYFVTKELQNVANEAITKNKIPNKFKISILAKGGGIHAQAEATRLGISRALIKFDTELRAGLKKAGFLKRDPRMVERKKFGLRKARKTVQWSKR